MGFKKYSLKLKTILKQKKFLLKEFFYRTILFTAKYDYKQKSILSQFLTNRTLNHKKRKLNI